MKTLHLSIIIILVIISSTAALVFAQVAPYIPGLESPLQQFRSGIKIQDIRCQPLFTLIMKSDDGSPACVKPSTAQKLVERGWGTITSKQEPSEPIPQVLPNGTSIIVLTEGQRYGPLLVQTISGNNVAGLDFREYPIATNVGYPITLHIGESASNGCTVELTLAKISGTRATFVIKEYQNRPCPICLSENTVIDTPNGAVSVKVLRVGMPILTQDASGHKQTAIILKTGRTLVPPDHKMVHLILADKRELYVSSNHPTADGRLFGELLVGDTLDGSKIKSIEVVPYNGTYTYDILPSGKTGFYWANGILAGSTLK